MINEKQEKKYFHVGKHNMSIADFFIWGEFAKVTLGVAAISWLFSIGNAFCAPRSVRDLFQAMFYLVWFVLGYLLFPELGIYFDALIFGWAILLLTGQAIFVGLDALLLRKNRNEKTIIRVISSTIACLTSAYLWCFLHMTARL